MNCGETRTQLLEPLMEKHCLLAYYSNRTKQNVASVIFHPQTASQMVALDYQIFVNNFTIKGRILAVNVLKAVSYHFTLESIIMTGF